ncbi:MAG TPA: hypothetical protein VFB42_01085 [Gaiellaceae bacterium]|nr:hypothetical protein [Gaiellaceae bacterium]
MKRRESLPEVGLVVSPAAAERERRVGRAEFTPHGKLGERLRRRVTVGDRLPDRGQRPLAAKLRGGGGERGPRGLEGDVPAVATDPLALLLVLVGERPTERLDPPLSGDDEEDVARLGLEEP